jgi:hypothetical protein
MDFNTDFVIISTENVSNNKAREMIEEFLEEEENIDDIIRIQLEELATHLD